MKSNRGCIILVVDKYVRVSMLSPNKLLQKVNIFSQTIQSHNYIFTSKGIKSWMRGVKFFSQKKKEKKKKKRK